MLRFLGKIFSSQKPKFPVGFTPDVLEKEQQKLRNPIPGLIIDLKKEKKPVASKADTKIDSNLSMMKKTNAKEKKQQPAIPASSSSAAASSSSNHIDNASVDVLAQQLAEASIDPTIEISKKLKRLRKKVRDTEILEEKIKNGQIKAEKDQLDKISRKSELLQEIQSLEEQRKKIHEMRDNK